MESSITLKDFLTKFKGQLEKKVIDKLAPLYSKNNKDKFQKAEEKLDNLTRELLPAQKEATLALYAGIKASRKKLILNGEMGVGKTTISLATAYLAGAKNVLVMCPGHLVRKWIREAKEIIPNVRTINLNGNTLGELVKLKNRQNEPYNGMTIYVIGKERAKLHYATEGAIEKVGNTFRCPKCGAVIDPENTEKIINGKSKKVKCEKCSEPLWQPADKPRRYAKSEFIKRYIKHHFDFFIADEVHELKGGTTAQGQAFANFVNATKGTTLALTGTLMGGYATNLYYIFWRLFPHKMKEHFNFNNTITFAENYGIIEEKTREMIEVDRYNLQSIGGSSKKRHYKKEKPGMSPALLTDFLLENTVFVKLKDISAKLPKYQEKIVSVQMSEEQESVYLDFESALRGIVNEHLKKGDKTYLGILLQSLLALPDGARRGEIVLDPHTKEPILHAPAITDVDMLNKEKELLSIVRNEHEQGRKVLVCLEHTDSRDLTGDLSDILTQNGFRTAVLKSNTVKPELREEWIKQKVDDIDVLITNPRIIQTGLDLLEFPSIVFFQPGYSVYTLRQASRRSWRIGQKEEVRVYYLVYKNTMQEKALTLMASKMETALALEGDLSDKGLVALSISESSILFALARELVDEEKKENENIVDLWSRVNEEEANADEYFGEKQEEVVKTESTKTITKGDKVVSSVSVKEEYIVRGKIYIKNGKGIAYVNKNKFVFFKGKVFYNNLPVGEYETKTGQGHIGKKTIRIAKGEKPNIYLLCEVRKTA